MIIYQICPKCNGQGTVSKPPYIAGDVTEWTDSCGSYTCDVCHGAKIIPTPNENLSDEQYILVKRSEYDQSERGDYPCDATETLPKEQP